MFDQVQCGIYFQHQSYQCQSDLICSFDVLLASPQTSNQLIVLDEQTH
jgi:hypothetical protein